MRILTGSQNIMNMSLLRMNTRTASRARNNWTVTSNNLQQYRYVR